MIRHLDDRRITRLGSGNDAYTFYHRICDIAADIIEVCLTCEVDYYSVEVRENGPGSRNNTSNARRISELKKAIPKLWSAAQKEGESIHYLNQLKALDQPERGALDTVSTNGLRACPLQVLKKKYSEDLLKFYVHVKFKTESEQIGEALLESELPKPQLRSAFVKMLNGPTEVREVARDFLHSLHK